MKCYINECANSWRREKKIKGITFHKFPKSSYKEWLECIGEDTDVEWPKNKKICSAHFTDDCFIHTGLIVRLKPGSKPTLHLKSVEVCSQQLGSISGSGTESTITLQSPEKLFVESESTISVTSPEIKDSENSPALRETLKRKLELSFKSSSSSSTVSKKARVVTKFHNYSSSFDKLEQKYSKIKYSLDNVRRKYHNTKKTVKRIKKKVQSLHLVLNTLKKKQMISTMASEHISQTFSAVPRALMARILKNKGCKSVSRSKFSPELRDFAMTLLFYSRKAYDFVRKTMDLSLPHPSTIRKIYSGIECKPGFTKSSFEVLKLKSNEFKLKNKELICSLIIDEMAIKKQVISDGKQIYGHVNFGCDNTDDLASLATEALVFLVVCHTEHWKIPIGYFLIQSLNGAEKANLVNEALIRLAEGDVTITSVTCDGPSANITMLKCLGCVFNNNPLQDKTYFQHPTTNDRVYAILDPCHMLKLMRNALGDMGQFIDDDNKLVEWKYIEKLYELQKSEGLSVGTKLNKAHMEWQRQKMKVKLAAQTLSSSVADAIEFLKNDLKLPDFQDSGPTIRFIRMIDRVFDILNSRSPVAKGYKAALKSNNKHFWRSFIERTILYLSKCKSTGGILMTSSRRKTPFIGFIISLSSTVGIFDDFVETKRLSYLLTYKFSQDHLELFFCSVRSKNGWNNNPNALQMEHTYKKLLYHSQVKGVGGNCDVIDSTTILALPSNQKSRQSSNECTFMIDFSIARKYNLDTETDEHDYDTRYSPSLSEYSENVVSYICGYVIRMVSRIIKCPTCIEAIQDVSKSGISSRYNLLSRKDRGGLLWPSEGMTVICIKCEEYIRRLLTVTGNKVPKESAYMNTIANSISQLYYHKNIFPDLENHYFDYEFNTNHTYLLIKAICSSYIKIRIYNLCKKQTEIVEGKKIRQTLNKLILFSNQ